MRAYMKGTFNRLLILVLVFAGQIASALADEVSSAMSADQLLHAVNLPNKYWQKDVLYVGKTGEVKIWVVRGYHVPKRVDESTCESDGIALQISRGLDSGVFKIDKKQNSKLVNISSDAQDCSHLKYEDYFLVSGGLSIKDAASTLNEINDSATCYAEGEAKCSNWNDIKVDDEDAKKNFLNVAKLPVIWVKRDNDDSSIEVRYRPLPGSQDFLVCTITSSGDSERLLEVYSGLVEGTGIKGSQ